MVSVTRNRSPGHCQGYRFLYKTGKVGTMIQIQFDWDSAKALANRAKHGVSFEEAMGIFDDPLSLVDHRPSSACCRGALGDERP